MKSKKTKLYTVVRVDSHAAKKNGRNTVLLQEFILTTCKTLGDAKMEFLADLAVLRDTVYGNKKLCQSIKHRRLWDPEFKFGHRWHIVESGPVVLSPWDEDSDGLLKINPGAKRYDVRRPAAE